VTETLQSKDEEVQDRTGRWWSIRIRPYKTTDNRIDGAVIAFVDIDFLKRYADQLRQGEKFAKAVVDTVREPLIVLDSELRIAFANPGFYQTFKLKAADASQRRIYELDGGEWKIPRLRELLEQILPRKRRQVEFKVEHDFPRIGRRQVRINARQLEYASETLILLAMTEVKDLS
jgi:two-component system CheB/CheR fusion protein